MSGVSAREQFVLRAGAEYLEVHCTSKFTLAFFAIGSADCAYPKAWGHCPVFLNGVGVRNLSLMLVVLLGPRLRDPG